MIAPKQESSDLVMQWLKSDISSQNAKISTQGDYVTIEADVSTIEKLLDAEYSVFGMLISSVDMISFSNRDSPTWHR